MATAANLGSIVSLNLGLAKAVDANGRKVRTGIFKSSVAGSVRLSSTGFVGDEQADLRVHGGPYKAVYSYPSEHYEYWRHELGLAELPWGAFGENITTSGFTESELTIGDRFQAGSAILQVSQPRMPCFKLALRFGRADMVKLFWKSGRSGTYFSVVREGQIAPNDVLTRIEAGPETVTIADVVRLHTGEEWHTDLRDKALRSPLRGSWKKDILARLTESS